MSLIQTPKVETGGSLTHTPHFVRTERNRRDAAACRIDYQDEAVGESTVKGSTSFEIVHLGHSQRARACEDLNLPESEPMPSQLYRDFRYRC